jgi:ATP-binding cassette subfamily B protein
LARALYKNAPLLVLDEPTAALDPLSEERMYKRYLDYSKGNTSIFISHRLASTRFCDRIVYLDNGKIEEIGTHEELLKQSKKYKEMFQIQAKYYQEGEEHGAN